MAGGAGMAGRILDADIAAVRERARIDEVVGEHLALRAAGGGQLKGLCPFHEEKSPSFHVSPAKSLFHCFGCGEGGDVIAFVQKVDHLSFTEAIEALARRVGVELRYEQGSAAPRQQHGQRSRLLEAHRAAAEFYAEQLALPVAEPGRRFLAERGFDQAVAERFGVGFAPPGWDALTRHLRGRGFRPEELVTGGLAQQGRQGPIDRFRGRLLWPIRDITGEVIGFGARRLAADDTGPKYLNTPETPLYRKSTVLYGVDLAKRDIAKRLQAVVVEGYTDVMACHLAGVTTAVATCGTAFGGEHVKVLRRLLMDQDEFRGEVIFTFDGDAAGQKAALRAFADDQRFITQTFVAVEPSGLDPCDLRRTHGDAAVADLVARRVPLFEFAVRSVLARHDLEIPEGRVQALAAAAPVVAAIRDRALRPEYARRLAGWLGMDVEPVLDAVGRAVPGGRGGPEPRPADGGPGRPDAGDPVLAVQREALKIAVQRPAHAGPAFDALEAEAFTDPGYAALRALIDSAGGCAAAPGGEEWVARLRDAAPDQLRPLVTELALDPLRSTAADDPRYASVVVSRVGELLVTRRTEEVRGRLQRTNPVEQVESYNRLFGELVELERQRRTLREQAIGAL